ncbi:uncharacterized protein [Henckelia pumila]|uniref:uncharacterized protein n=1 Tax=Henckelia pumila TaxID=405737 RepID=UPI003C6E72B0
MDPSPYSSSSSDSSQFSSTNSSPAKGSSTVVLSIECLKGSSKADEWTGDMLQTGDIVEELRIGNMFISSPFKKGKSEVQKILHNSFRQKETSIHVRVRRGADEYAELQACIVPGDQFVGRRQYVLRAIDDPNYAVGFLDRKESDCFELQASRMARMVIALQETPLQDGYVSYPWDRRMRDMLSIPYSSSFYSILFLPKASDIVNSRYNDLEDTLARAHAWINASQASGAPIVFMNIQTESLLTKVSGETASATVNAGSLSDLSNLANTSLYGFEDYHGVDIGVVRAVRMWFSPLVGEIPIEIRIGKQMQNLVFAISRTEEANSSSPSRLLIVSRISNQKVLPWMVSTTGAIRCFDTVSLSQKLSLHRHTRLPILMHVFLWDRNANVSNVGSIRARAMSTCPPTAPAKVNLPHPPFLPSLTEDDDLEDSVAIEGSDLLRERDTAGEFSFRSHEFTLTDNWV